MTLVSYYELGQIAAAASEVSGKTVSNPFPYDTFARDEWERGYSDEIEKILKEGS